MKPDMPKTIFLKDYQLPHYFVKTIDLVFELGENASIVKSIMMIQAGAETNIASSPLILDGQELELLVVKLDDVLLSESQYTLSESHLIIPDINAEFKLEIQTRIKPQENTSLEGLYQSSGNFCTQCEAEGFRKITYYIDRPDNMAIFTTTIYADKRKYPVLLSNGNPIAQGEADDKHWVKWHDPYPKPCYLFALVAGDLRFIEDQFTTQSGRHVALRLYVEPRNIDKCEHAMQSLKAAMKWDEAVYGLEYDLDIYMIVAVDDFNMGAMENKGLNVFNSQYVLAQPDSATDQDYEGIEGVIAHEYFHNWTGNRITCRDWFQLSLKEGLTVFRDQEFSADIGSRAVNRIGDVRVLRTRQFLEDSGPMAHPIRPDNYIEISNFYTVTIYNKGAEVIRMMHTMLGAEGFRKGIDLYFERHDGQAVTTDDFAKAMEDANQYDLSQFKRWYHQAGTPKIRINTKYDAENETYEITLQQQCPPTPGQSEKAPFHIPVLIGLLDAKGHDIPTQMDTELASVTTGGRLLHLKDETQTFRFVGLKERPVLSSFRNFSAPVSVISDSSDDDLYFLIANDNDYFNRWDAAERLSVKLILQRVSDIQQGRNSQEETRYLEALAQLLQDEQCDQALKAQILTLPSETYLAEQMTVADPVAVHQARNALRIVIAQYLQTQMRLIHQNNQIDHYDYNAEDAAKRSLKNVCLSYLMELTDHQIIEICLKQFNQSDNMTDVLSALAAFSHTKCEQRSMVLQQFYQQWQNEILVVNKWLGIQALSRLPGTLDAVKRLMEHEAFDIKNPNKVRALIATFCIGNPSQFHAINGEGYAFLADQIITLDTLNPQIAARLLTPMTFWRRYDDSRQQMLISQLKRIGAVDGLSKDVYEIVSKSLAD